MRLEKGGEPMSEIFNPITDVSAIDVARLDENTSSQIKNFLQLIDLLEITWNVAEEAEQHLKTAEVAGVCGYQDAAKHHASRAQEVNGDFLRSLSGLSTRFSEWASRWPTEDSKKLDKALNKATTRKDLLTQTKRQFREIVLEEPDLMPLEALEFLGDVDSILDKAFQSQRFDDLLKQLKNQLEKVEKAYSGNALAYQLTVSGDNKKEIQASERSRRRRCMVRVVILVIVVVVEYLLCFFVLCLFGPTVIKRTEKTVVRTYRRCRRRRPRIVS